MSLWVFGYGSLMWRPGFAFEEKHCAVMPGHQRHFCLYSTRYRGTPKAPGLVLGLDKAPGEECRGVAFRVADEHRARTMDYLREREMVTDSYAEVTRHVHLIESGETVETLCYLIRRDHPQYAGGLSLARQAEIISRAEGPFGTNREYLENTLKHLASVGVRDANLLDLAKLVETSGRP